MSSNKSFCILPWISADILPNGEVSPCCYFLSSAKTFSLNDNNLKSYLSSEFTNSIKDKMLSNEVVAECSYCNSMDCTSKASSPRTLINTQHANLVANVKNQTYSKTIITDLTLRNTNTCNLACRTCNSFCSTGWFSDTLALSQNASRPLNYNVAQINESFNSDLKEIIPQLNSLHLLGGEPLLINDYDNYLELILSTNDTQPYVEYTTNLSLNSQVYLNKISDWKKLDDLAFVISVDAIFQQAEYLRHNLNWELFETNLQLLIKELPSAKIRFNITVSIYNILSIDSIFHFLASNPLYKEISININPLSKPEYLNVQSLPADVKCNISDTYAQLLHTEIYLSNNEYRKALMLVQSYLNATHLKTDALAFNLVTKKLDSLRNQDFSKTFPDLLSAIKPYGYF